jgi:hypothetical protein
MAPVIVELDVPVQTVFAPIGVRRVGALAEERDRLTTVGLRSQREGATGSEMTTRSRWTSVPSQ